jgi:hypothetical protein
MIEGIDKMFNNKSFPSLWIAMMSKRTSTSSSFHWHKVNCFKSNWIFLGFTKSCKTKPRRAVFTSTTASVFSFGQWYQFLLLKSPLVSKIVYPSLRRNSTAISSPNFPNSLCSAIFVSIQFQICTVILAFRDINLQAVFKNSISKPLLARRLLSAICICIKRQRLKQY